MTDTNSVSAFLAEQKRLADAATEGPWVATMPGAIVMSQVGYPGSDVARVVSENWRADYGFIAAARSSHPRMGKALEAVLALPVEVESDSPDMAQGWKDAMVAVRQRIAAALEGVPDAVDAE